MNNRQKYRSKRNKNSLKRKINKKKYKKSIKSRKQQRGGNNWAPWEGNSSSGSAIQSILYNRFQRVPYLHEMVKYEPLF